MDANKLAAEILADGEAEAATPGYEAPECFSCGRTFHCTGPDGSGRFCSVRCRGWFDDGNPPYEKRVRLGYTLRMGRHGFVIPCRGCGKDFDSKGSTYCSPGCNKASAARAEAAALMAEVGMDIPEKRMCATPGCPRISPSGGTAGRSPRPPGFAVPYALKERPKSCKCP